MQAPEALLDGLLSPDMDIYAFGEQSPKPWWLLKCIKAIKPQPGGC